MPGEGLRLRTRRRERGDEAGIRANVQGGMVSYQAHATACTDVWGKDPTTENPKASSTCANGEGGALARVRFANSAPKEGRKEERGRERERERERTKFNSTI